MRKPSPCVQPKRCSSGVSRALITVLVAAARNEQQAALSLEYAAPPWKLYGRLEPVSLNANTDPPSFKWLGHP